MKHNLFAYGSLAFPEVLRLMRDMDYRLIDATLWGYKIMTIKRDIFPTIVADDSSKVQGKLILGLDDEFLKDLDEYEGDDYSRISGKAETPEGMLECFYYVNRVHDAGSLIPGWDSLKFREHNLEDLQKKFIADEITDDKI
jgi:gamma-glutamylcyclotransferase (GGCT)/AIG2-like uncharacterized protein YtfP